MVGMRIEKIKENDQLDAKERQKMADLTFSSKEMKNIVEGYQEEGQYQLRKKNEEHLPKSLAIESKTMLTNETESIINDIVSSGVEKGERRNKTKVLLEEKGNFNHANILTKEDSKKELSKNKKLSKQKTVKKKEHRIQSNRSSRRNDHAKNKEPLPIGGIIFLFGMIAVVGCAVMAHFGFQGRIHTVGIDLGTTFSVVAVNEHGTVRVIGRDGKYGMDINGHKKKGVSLQPGWEKSTLLNFFNIYEKLLGQLSHTKESSQVTRHFIKEDEKKECEIHEEEYNIKVNPLVASITYFDQENGVIVGDEAKSYLTRDPQHTIYNAKRFIGQDYLDPSVQEEASRHPFYVVPYKAPQPIIKTKESMKRMRFASGVGFNLLPNTRNPTFFTSADTNDAHNSSFNIKYIQRLLKQLTKEIQDILLQKLDFFLTKLNLNIQQNSITTSYPENYVDLLEKQEQNINGRNLQGPIVPPEDIGSYVVNHLKNLAIAYLGHDQLTTAIIAVPAKFNGRQKQATVSAFNKAGFKVNRIIEEPTAAALAYGLHQKPTVHHILVYDFGGGTLDVSLLYVKDGFVSVMGIEGDEHLGGSDFDHCVEGYLLDKYDHVSTVSMVTEESLLMGLSSSQLPECASYTRLMIAEDLKKKLSAISEYPEMKANFYCTEPKYVSERNTETKVINTYHSFSISNEEFYSTCSSVFERVLKPVERILEYSSMTSNEIDEVVMVGGTTRIPKINELLKSYLKKDNLNNHIDPDITVAVGVACIID